jgi:hypothetical protein
MTFENPSGRIFLKIKIKDKNTSKGVVHKERLFGRVFLG